MEQEKPTSFYRRPLPSSCVAFASPEGRRLFSSAFADGLLEGSYFRLAEQFHTQNEPAFCGLGTLCMVLNALAVDPLRLWKGVWRWFSEDLLDCCTPLEQIKTKGITIEEFVCLAKCNGAVPTVVRVRSQQCARAYAAFRKTVKRVCSDPEGPLLVVSYTRAKLQQTGTGHFSPIAAYDEKSDSVLIMDVARFKYPPHWVALETMVDAMSPCDPSTGMPRGYILLERADTEHGGLPALCSIRLPSEGWGALRSMFERAAGNITGLSDRSVEGVVAAILGSVPCTINDIIDVKSFSEGGRLEEMCEALRRTECFSIVSNELENGEICACKITDKIRSLGTLFCLAFPEQSLDLPPDLKEEFQNLRREGAVPEIAAEVALLRTQLESLLEVPASRCTNC